MECTNGVRENKSKAGVPLDELTKILKPKYVVTDFTIDTPRVRSPRTGMVCAIHHSRTYVLGLRKDLDYAHRPHNPPGQGELLIKTAAHLIRNIESHYMVMPLEDRRDLDIFKKKQGVGTLKGTMAAITKIRSYSEELAPRHHSNEMGSGGFPNTAYDLQSSLLPTYTAAGGSRWVYTTLNGLVVPRLLSTLEAAAAYGLENGDLEMLSPDSEYGQSAIGNCIPQPVADALAQFISNIRTALIRPPLGEAPIGSTAPRHHTPLACTPTIANAGQSSSFIRRAQPPIPAEGSGTALNGQNAVSYSEEDKATTSGQHPGQSHQRQGVTRPYIHQGSLVSNA